MPHTHLSVGFRVATWRVSFLVALVSAVWCYRRLAAGRRMRTVWGLASAVG